MSAVPRRRRRTNRILPVAVDDALVASLRVDPYEGTLVQPRPRGPYCCRCNREGVATLLVKCVATGCDTRCHSYCMGSTVDPTAAWICTDTHGTGNTRCCFCGDRGTGHIITRGGYEWCRACLDAVPCCVCGAGSEDSSCAKNTGPASKRGQKKSTPKGKLLACEQCGWRRAHERCAGADPLVCFACADTALHNEEVAWAPVPARPSP